MSGVEHEFRPCRLRRRRQGSRRGFEVVPSPPVDDPRARHGLDFLCVCGPPFYLADNATGPSRHLRHLFEPRIVDDPVEAVLLAHHAVTEAKGCSRKFDRHVGRGSELIELAPVPEDRGHDSLLGQPLQEVVQNNPLIVPGHDAACLRKRRFRGSGPVRQLGDDLVVKFQEGKMSLRHDEVLIIAMVTDERAPLAVPRQIVLEFACRHIHRAVLSEQKLGTGRTEGRIWCCSRALVEVRATVRTQSVERIQIEPRRPEISRRVRIF